MPLLEGLLLLQFIMYSRMTKLAYFVAGTCSLLWIIIIVLQIFFSISEELEWLSIALWSAETVPQVVHYVFYQHSSGFPALAHSFWVINRYQFGGGLYLS